MHFTDQLDVCIAGAFAEEQGYREGEEEGNRFPSAQVRTEGLDA
jgi:hypothetical protein